MGELIIIFHSLFEKILENQHNIEHQTKKKEN